MDNIQNHKENQQTINESKDLNSNSPKSTILHKTQLPFKRRISINPYDTFSVGIWKESSTSMTRDHSPSHKIGNGSRFVSYAEEQMKNSQFLTLQLRKDITTHQGVRFPISKRPDHFYKFSKHDYPSPASYKLQRLLDDKDNDSKDTSIMSKTVNPQSFNHVINKSAIKGITIPGFNKYHKSFVKHSEHTPYQAQFTLGHPGPGHYNHTFKNKDKKPSYSIRKPLKRFNQTISMNPGPGAYQHTTSRDKYTSINQKGTIPHSFRTYLTKFDENPSPNKYVLKRFLEQSK